VSCGAGIPELRQMPPDLGETFYEPEHLSRGDVKLGP